MIQCRFIRMIPGFRNIRVMKNGYGFSV